MEELRKENAELAAGIKDLRREIDEIVLQGEEIDRQNADNLKAAQEQCDKQVAAARAAASELQDRLERERVESRETSAEYFQNILAQYRAGQIRIAELTAEVDALKRQASECRERSAGQAESMAAARVSRERLEKEVAEAKQQLRKEVASKFSERESLAVVRESRDGAVAQVAALKGQLAAAEERLADARLQIEAKQATIATLLRQQEEGEKPRRQQIEVVTAAAVEEEEEAEMLPEAEDEVERLKAEVNAYRNREETWAARTRELMDTVIGLQAFHVTEELLRIKRKCEQKQ